MVDEMSGQNGRTLVKLLGVIAFMGAMAWASVPLYDLFCRVTGYGGTTQVADAASDRVLDRTMKIRFDGSVANDMPWQFRPAKNVIELRIGETGLAFYEATNPTDRTVTGTAAFNVSPPTVGAYFDKIDCFCFTEQTLKPGESVMMPVTFYVDPDIVDDPDTVTVREITLSYTFYETEPEHAGLDDDTTPTAASGG